LSVVSCEEGAAAGLIEGDLFSRLSSGLHLSSVALGFAAIA